MKPTINKTKLAALILTILLMISVSTLMINPPVNAQELERQPSGSQTLPSGVTPDLSIDTMAFLSFRPTSMGVNQIFLVNMWISPALHASRSLSDYKVTITKPSGEQHEVIMDSYCADATAWFEWIADEVGEWSLKFEFPGGYFPAGIYSSGLGRGADDTSFSGSCYYKPSSTAEQTLVVTEEMVYSWPESAYPTDYWERPVAPENREWWSTLGNFPWHGPGGGPMWDERHPETNIYQGGVRGVPRSRFTAWVTAPNSAHVVWKREGNIAGLIGGDVGPITLDIGGGGYPNVIVNGRAYQAIPKTGTTGPEGQTYWQCYNLRTGEIYWERPLFSGESEPTNIEYSSGELRVPGETAYAGRITISLLSIGDRLLKYDPSTGELVTNVTGMSGTYYMNEHVLSVQNIGGENYRLINWTTASDTSNFADRVLSNITWPWSNLGTTQDFNAGIAARSDTVTPSEMGAWYGTRMRAANLLTGQELWDKTVTDTMYSSRLTIADHGKVATAMMGNHWMCWNLYNGDLEWTSEMTTYPWGNFWAYSVASAYGMIYSGSYDATYAFDWDDGSIVWKYEAESPFDFETAYTDDEGETVYPWQSSLHVADGKVFTYTIEHTPSQPIARGYKWHCINATTGEEVWTLPGSGRISRIFPGAIADGYLVLDNWYYATMYVIGKGKSETTVTSPDVAVPKGNTFTIKGTVLDISPAQSNTPCVSEEAMNTWMAYLHMGHPINGFKNDEIITGVPVTLTAIDEDGKLIDIGTTITDGYYGSFGLSWTPSEEGTYKIIASFEGTESYGSSGASTFVTVDPAISPDAPIEPEEATEAPFISTEVAIIAAVAIAAVIGIVAYGLLRKRK